MGALLTDVMTSLDLFAVAALEALFLRRAYSELHLGAFLAVFAVVVTFTFVDTETDSGSVTALGVVYATLNVVFKSVASVFNSHFLKGAAGGDWMLKATTIGLFLMCYNSLQLLVFSILGMGGTLFSAFCSIDIWGLSGAVVLAFRMISVILILRVLSPLAKTLALSCVCVCTGLLSFIILSKPFSKSQWSLLVVLGAVVFIAVRSRAVLDGVYMVARSDTLAVVEDVLLASEGKGSKDESTDSDASSSRSSLGSTTDALP